MSVLEVNRTSDCGRGKSDADGSSTGMRVPPRNREDRINVRVAELIGMQRCFRHPVVTVKAKLLGLIERAALHLRHKPSFGAQPEGVSDPLDKLLIRIIDCGAKLLDRE